MLRKFLRRLTLRKVEFVMQAVPGAEVHKGYLLGYCAVVSEYKHKNSSAELSTVNYIAVIEPKKPIKDQHGNESNVMVDSKLVRLL